MREINKGENNPFFGQTHSEEYKKLLKERKSGKNNHMHGKPVTEENKQLISQIFSKPIYLYDSNTFLLIEKYLKQRDLIEELKISTKTIVKYKDSGMVFRNKYIITSKPIDDIV